MTMTPSRIGLPPFPSMIVGPTIAMTFFGRSMLFTCAPSLSDSPVLIGAGGAEGTPDGRAPAAVDWSSADPSPPRRPAPAAHRDPRARHPGPHPPRYPALRRGSPLP